VYVGAPYTFNKTKFIYQKKKKKKQKTKQIRKEKKKKKMANATFGD
jgi:hypothetical protein